jgi:Domain of unknown function (DUF4157)
MSGAAMTLSFDQQAHAEPAPIAAPHQQRLPSGLREKFAAHLGAEFDDIGISSTGAAPALTVGDAIAFGETAYQPESGWGRELIAHELAHIVQQRGGTGGPSDPVELARAGNAAVGVALGGGGGESDAARPLDPSVRATAELALGRPLDGVRVHRGPAAAAAARRVDARAFTVGEDIVLGESVPGPDSQDGMRALGHELAHVVQQRLGGSVPESAGSLEAEREAEDVGHALASARRSGPVMFGTAVGIARQPMDPRHARGYAGEQGMGFTYYRQEDGWILFEGPSGWEGHGTTQSGFDGVAYNTRTGEIHLPDNKSLARTGNVGSAPAIDPERNLAQNLDGLIGRVEAAKDVPGRVRLLSRLRALRTSLAAGKPLPPDVRLVVTSSGGQSTGVTKRLEGAGVKYQPEPTRPPILSKPASPPEAVVEPVTPTSTATTHPAPEQALAPTAAKTPAAPLEHPSGAPEHAAVSGAEVSSPVQATPAVSTAETSSVKAEVPSTVPPKAVGEGSVTSGLKGAVVEEGAAAARVGRSGFTLRGFGGAVAEFALWMMVDYIFRKLGEMRESKKISELMTSNVDPRIKQRLAELNDKVQRLAIENPYATVYANVTVNLRYEGQADEYEDKREGIHDVTFSDLKPSLKPEEDFKEGKEVTTFRNPLSGHRSYEVTRSVTFPLPLQFPEIADSMEGRQLGFTAQKLVGVGIAARGYAEAATFWSEGQTERFVQAYIQASTGNQHDDAVNYLEELRKRPQGWRRERPALTPSPSVPTIERASP